jgi:hypothetical protein
MIQTPADFLAVCQFFSDAAEAVLMVVRPLYNFALGFLGLSLPNARTLCLEGFNLLTLVSNLIPFQFRF